jgi:AhpD family alkylhydroperoxidase
MGFVRLKVSLMNGCEYCVRVHTAELKRANETVERIAGVEDWRGSEAYTKRERAALAWAEAVTNIQDGHAPDVLYEAVRAQFTDVETVNLTLVITTIDAWNRITIALGAHSGHAHTVKG